MFEQLATDRTHQTLPVMLYALVIFQHPIEEERLWALVAFEPLVLLVLGAVYR